MRLSALGSGIVRLACAAAAVVLTSIGSAAAISSSNATTTTTTNATHVPLFPVGEGDLQTLHLSLASLLPVLPHLAPGPDHTLAVTLATPAFKPLLYNWLCFLRYKAKWGQPAQFNVHGEPNTRDRDPFPDTPKVLVVTSDEDLALELSENGVVTWLLLGIDWEAFDEAELMDEDDPRKGEALDFVQRMMSDDLFTNLRLLDLLLPPDMPYDPEEVHKAIPWGTLRYQSLMLERTAVMSALVGALVESQRSEATWRKEQDAYWRERVLAHDWESGPLETPKFAGVKGVLLVDNDAVWFVAGGFFAHPSISLNSPCFPASQAFFSYRLPLALLPTDGTASRRRLRARHVTFDQKRLGHAHDAVRVLLLYPRLGRRRAAGCAHLPRSELADPARPVPVLSRRGGRGGVAQHGLVPHLDAPTSPRGRRAAVQDGRRSPEPIRRRRCATQPRCAGHGGGASAFVPSDGARSGLVPERASRDRHARDQSRTLSRRARLGRRRRLALLARDCRPRARPRDGPGSEIVPRAGARVPVYDPGEDPDRVPRTSDFAHAAILRHARRGRTAPSHADSGRTAPVRLVPSRDALL